MRSTEEAANVVRLRGALSADAETRSLPSGDELVLLRVVVDRPGSERRDSIPVVVGPPPGQGRRRRRGQASAATLRRASSLAAGTAVEVDGWIERRFWAAGDGSRRTRLQVVAEEIRRA